MMRLPENIDPGSFDDELRPDVDAWRGAVLEVCHAHRLDCAAVEPFTQGSKYGPSMFSCNGDARLIGALFRGYFGHARPIEEPTRMRLMAFALLHRYADFEVQLRIADWRERVSSLEALAELVWPRGE